MANREHILLLLKAIASGDCRAWNNWRIDHSTFLPQLSAAELWHMDIPFINLSRSALIGADLSEANLYRANLEYSDLRMSIMKNANLNEANLQNANLFRANLKGSDLRRANLRGADLRQAKLSGALLSDANLTGTILDPEALKESEGLCEGGVSRFERFALRLASMV